MIYIEYHYKNGDKENGSIQKINLDCEFHETNRFGIYVWGNFDSDNPLREQWIEKIWFDLSKYCKLTCSYVDPKIVAIVMNELRKEKLNRILNGQ